jgi:hypothetical protein
VDLQAGLTNKYVVHIYRVSCRVSLRLEGQNEWKNR